MTWNHCYLSLPSTRLESQGPRQAKEWAAWEGTCFRFNYISFGLIWFLELCVCAPALWHQCRGRFCLWRSVLYSLLGFSSSRVAGLIQGLFLRTAILSALGLFLTYKVTGFLGTFPYIFCFSGNHPPQSSYPYLLSAPPITLPNPFLNVSFFLFPCPTPSVHALTKPYISKRWKSLLTRENPQCFPFPVRNGSFNKAFTVPSISCLFFYVRTVCYTAEEQTTH